MQRVLTAGLLAVAIGAGSAGCSDSGGSSTASSPATSASGPSADPALCASADDLRNSIAAIADVQVVTNGTSAVKEALQAVRTDVNEVAQHARGQYRDQVDTVQADLAAVDTAVNTAQADSNATTLGAVATGISTLATDARALIDDVKSTC
jgi:hypothetical protein